MNAFALAASVHGFPFAELTVAPVENETTITWLILTSVLVSRLSKACLASVSLLPSMLPDTSRIMTMLSFGTPSPMATFAETGVACGLSSSILTGSIACVVS